MPEQVPVATKSELVEGQGKCVTVGDKRIALFLSEGNVYAIDDTCTHEDGPLSEGELDGTEVECPWHGASFNIASGEALSAPAYEDVNAYPVTIDGDQIKVEV